MKAIANVLDELTIPADLVVKQPDGSVRCTACGHRCLVRTGRRGICQVRFNQNSVLRVPWGYVAALNADPVEKKPFYHVLPATLSFSLATAGCNLNCKFCQNWEISQARPDDTLNYDLPPKAVVEGAKRNQCQSIASTYVEPTIFIEYMLEIGQLAREQKILKVIHSNGFINATPLQDLCKVLDAACIDLKGFTDDYYRDLTEGSLSPVLATTQTTFNRPGPYGVGAKLTWDIEVYSAIAGVGDRRTTDWHSNVSLELGILLGL